MTGFNWREHLKIHPAAALFPPMPEDELKELAEDIKHNGLLSRPVLAAISLRDDNGEKTGKHEVMLLDGRNRLDALASLGWLAEDDSSDDLFQSALIGLSTEGAEDLSEEHTVLFEWGSGFGEHDPDLYAKVISLNLHRRHLTPAQKREVIANFLKRQPEISDRQIGEMVKADHKTVGLVREKLEATGEIPQLDKTIAADGKSRRKPGPPADEVQVNGQAADVGQFSPAAQARVADSADACKQDYAEAEAAATKFHCEIGSYVADFEGRFREWFQSTDLPEEAKDSLHDLLMVCADTLMTLAQEIDGRGAEAEIEAA